MAGSYTIPEEPDPGGLARLAVNPMWPLFGALVAPGPVGWAWFVANAYITRSPSRHREAIVAGIALIPWAGLLVLQLQVFALWPEALPYVNPLMHVYKLCIAYVLWVMQSRTWFLWEELERPVAPGWIGVALLYFLVGPYVTSTFRDVGLLPPTARQVAEQQIRALADADTDADTDSDTDPDTEGPNHE